MNYGVDDCLTHSPYNQTTNRNNLLFGCRQRAGFFNFRNGNAEMAVTPAISAPGQEQLARALRDTGQLVRLTHDEAVVVIAAAIALINSGNYV